MWEELQACSDSAPSAELNSAVRVCSGLIAESIRMSGIFSIFLQPCQVASVATSCQRPITYLLRSRLRQCCVAVHGQSTTAAVISTVWITVTRDWRHSRQPAAYLPTASSTELISHGSTAAHRH